jgi:hypothetical protein
MVAQRWMWIAWPAFLAAAVMEMLVFAFVDPLELHLAGESVAWSRNAVYTVSFFVFWAAAMFSSMLTTLLGRSLAELNGTAAQPAAIHLAEHDWQPD